MGKFFRYFWTLFILYFIFGHPAIIYYNIRSTDNLASQDGKLTLFYLGLSFVLWFLVLAVSLYFIYRNSFIAQKNVQELLRNGIPASATIIESKKLKSYNKSYELKELVLELKNLQGEKIRHKMQVNDSRPQERRYEAGNHVNLRIDKDFEKSPFIILQDTQTKINFQLYVIWVLFAAAVIYYYVYSYNLESLGYGWRFLVFWHPLIISPLAIFLFGSIFYFIIFKLMGKLTFTGKDAMKIKFCGIRTTAKILSTSQTGVSINDQPEVKFELEFTDKKGITRHAVLKKIVPLIHLSSVNTRSKEIFYLPENPEKVAFSDDLNAV